MKFSPWLFVPKRVGATFSVNALTKYIGGHGNALGGSVTETGAFDWTRYPNIYDEYKGPKPALWGLTQIRKKGLRDWGATLSPEQAHHLAVGAETLALRMERACANAQAVAQFLAALPVGGRGIEFSQCLRVGGLECRSRFRQVPDAAL